jgi:hypothetical protein
VDNLTLTPLGAGDLIDRAIRLYRRHFATLLRIAAPPVVISAFGAVLTTIGFREFTITRSSGSLLVYGVILLFGVVLNWSGLLFQVVVMGGATRNLVTHLLWNEPFTARRTYRNVRSRFFGLLGAALVVALCVMFATGVASFVWYLMVIIVVFGAVAIAQAFPVWLAATIGTLASVALTFVALAIFFFLVSRLAYVPQVMLVEGKGIADSVRRSFALARGNVRRLMAMSIFTWLAAYSALMILVIPLGWYGYLNGINPFALGSSEWPVWFAVGYSVLGQLSSILIAPVWMLGLSLLYLDERVRHEGYDIELLAARQLPPMPDPDAVVSRVYTPALVTHEAHREKLQSGSFPESSTLGLR